MLCRKGDDISVEGVNRIMFSRLHNITEYSTLDGARLVTSRWFYPAHHLSPSSLHRLNLYRSLAILFCVFKYSKPSLQSIAKVCKCKTLFTHSMVPRRMFQARCRMRFCVG